MTDYTAAEKLKEIVRELYLRNKVYPSLIAKNQMTHKAAKHHIAVMEAIAEDYRENANQEKGSQL